MGPLVLCLNRQFGLTLAGTKGKTMNKEALQRRAEVAMWGCLACAQPWLILGQGPWGFLFSGAALVAWLVALDAGRK